MKRTLILGLFTASLSLAQTKKAMSIEDFDYSTVMTAVQSIFGTQQNIGQGINAMMTTRIARDGKYTVVERRKVGALTKEQDFAASNRVKQGTGARIGQIRGADLTLMGDIVVFGRDDRKVSGAIGAAVPGAGGVAGGYKSDNKAVVVLDYRLVDAETSEVVATGEARGESKRTSKGFGAALLAGGVFAGGAVNMASSNFGETIIGEATMDAVNKLAEQLNGQTLTGGASSRENDLDARVAAVGAGTVTINAGAAAGLQIGQSFTVYHKGKEIKDPVTGEVLDVETTPLGKMTITVVRDRIATGSYSGSGTPAVGDIVRK
jgi:curli biogenesis system outer membrane secretion channel CsgG